MPPFMFFCEIKIFLCSTLQRNDLDYHIARFLYFYTYKFKFLILCWILAKLKKNLEI